MDCTIAIKFISLFHNDISLQLNVFNSQLNVTHAINMKHAFYMKQQVAHNIIHVVNMKHVHSYNMQYVAIMKHFAQPLRIIQTYNKTSFWISKT